MQFPQFPVRGIPTLPSLSLSAAERATIDRLQRDQWRCRPEMELAEAYYLGEQVITNLRIAVPTELEFLRTIVGWGALAVDPYVERHGVDCFRLPNGTDADQYLSDIATANGFDAELPLAITDALSMGHGYWMVGSPLESGGAPQITVESPLNMSVGWDLRGLEPTEALAQYWRDGRHHAALVLPFKTVHIAVDDNGQWVIVDRDEHGFDFVPVARMANQARTNNRAGRSAITPALRSTIDSTCRTLMGLEVAREIYSAPRMILAGASESDFQKTDGTPKSAWDTYITRVLALERDEEGNVPELKQLTAYDPGVFTKLIDNAAARAASIVLAPPQDIGLYTQGNPISADALNTSEARRNRRARSQQREFGVPIANVMKMAARFDNKGVLPEKYAAIAVDWLEVEEVALVAASDAVSKQVAAGSIPPTSDVTLKRLGYNAVERARLERDRKREEGRRAANAIAASLTPAQPAAEPTAIPEAPSAAAGL